MLDKYLAGIIPQAIERGRVLKAIIPRDLPKEYTALRVSCNHKIDEYIRGLQYLQSSINPNLVQEQLRTFKRLVSDLDAIETVGITALSRACSEDHKINSLTARITQEIKYPLITPVVTTLSQSYFCIYPSLGLLCIPLLEGKFLLHLPDLYHELAHPFFTEKNDPVIEPFQYRFEDAIVEALTHFEQEKLNAEVSRGPQQLYDLLHSWQRSWIRYWMVEFFCDLYAVYTLGAAFVWSHLHLAIERGSDPYQVPFQVTSHPCDCARMAAMLHALNLLGFEEKASEIELTWNEFLSQIEAQPEPEYYRCYPADLIKIIAERALDASKEINSRIVTPNTSDPFHNLLNRAWDRFWQDPLTYADWEKQEVQKILPDGSIEL
jgi:hypothetical protein